MPWIILISLIILFLLMWNQTRDIMFPGCIFNLVWIFVVILYIFNFGNLYEVNTKTYLLIYLGLICINVPYLFSSNRYGHYYRQYSKKRVGYALSYGNTNVFLFIQIVLIIAMIPFTIKMVSVGESLGLRRQLFSTNYEDIMTYPERLIYIYFGVFPGISAQNIITTLILFKGRASKGYKAIHSLLALTLIILRIVTDGGRMIVVDTIICVFLAACFTVEWKKTRLDFKKAREQSIVKRRVTVIVIIAAVVSLAITMSRSSGVVSPIVYSLRMISRYFTIGPRLLEHAINKPVSFGLNDWSWGGIFWGGLLEIPRSFLAVLGVKMPSFFTIAQQEMGNYYPIGPGINSNAFPTMFYYFMKDMGIFGVLFESLLFGCLSVRIYGKLNRSPSNLYLGLFYLVLIVIAYGMCWWPLYRPEYYSTLFLFLLFSKALRMRLTNDAQYDVVRQCSFCL